MISFILSVFDYIVKLPKNSKFKNHAILALIIFASVYVWVNYRIDYVIEKMHIQTIKEQQADDTIITSMRSLLKNINKKDVYISWIRLECKGNKYYMAWKDIYTFDRNNKPVSVKYFSPLFMMRLEVDGNTAKLLCNAPENMTAIITREIAQDSGFKAVNDIYTNTVTGVDRSLITIVKRNDTTIWIFSLCSKGQIKDVPKSKLDMELLTVANIARNSYFGL
jgi:hypothetical protein